jgi:dihydrodipicolinate synthase/N-acetylneuraminate lyase
MQKRYPKVILATACIPWDENFEFMEATFRIEVRNLINRGVNHIYLFGTAGEGYAVTDDQFEQIVAVFADEMSGPDLFPMVAVVSLSLPVMRERVKRAYDLGIRDFQFAFPSWGALSDDEIEIFMHSLCDPYPDCRFLHYNLNRSKRLLQMQDYMRLAELFPNFAGAKYPTTHLFIIHELMENESPLQFFLTELGFGYSHIIGGECGLLLSLGNSHIRRASLFFQAAVAKEFNKIAAFQNEFYGLYRILMQSVSDSRMDGAYDKVYCKLVDPSFPLRLLPPYQSSTDEQFETYKNDLQRYYPQWLES